jgi:hypothetical protein
MKRIILLSLFLMILSSCEITVLEEPIPIIIEDARDYFTGYFDAEEYSRTSGVYTYYTIRVVKSSRNNNVVFIRNFYGLDIEVLAEVNGRDLYIPEQDVNDYHIEGQGSLYGRELVLNYSVHDHLDPHSNLDICETVALR